MKKNKTYTIDRLANLAGISVRTLRHYDHVGLLRPSGRNDSGHRIYTTPELLKLQQILFYKELDFSLNEITELLTKKIDLESALLEQKRLLQKERKRITTLLETLDKTILHIKEKSMLSDKDLYEGFSDAEIAEMKAEVKAKYDPKIVAESERKVKAMSKERFEQVKKEGGEITLAIANLMGKKPVNSKEVQELIKKHYEHIGNFYTPTLEIYKGLGNLYVQDARFTAFYDKVKPGLAGFMKEGIDFFCDNQRRS